MVSPSKPIRQGVARWDVIVGVLLGLMMISIVLPFLVSTILLPQNVRTPAARTQTINNLKQMALALHGFNDIHRRLPPAFDRFDKMVYPVSVHVFLLPYVEQDPLYLAYLRQSPGKHDEEVVAPFLDPLDFSSENLKGAQNFAANLRVFTDKGVETPFNESLARLAHVEPGRASIPKTFLDGTSNTIAFATRYAVCSTGGSRYAAAPDSPFGAYIGENAATVKAHPTNPTATFLLSPKVGECVPTPFMAHAPGTGGLLVGLADGSVRTLEPKISPETWNRAMQPNDGGELGSEW